MPPPKVVFPCSAVGPRHQRCLQDSCVRNSQGWKSGKPGFQGVWFSPKWDGKSLKGIKQSSNWIGIIYLKDLSSCSMDCGGSRQGSRLLLSLCGRMLSFLLGKYLGMELLETAQTSIKRWMDKHIVICSYNKILVSSKNKELLVHTITWTSLKTIMLSKTSQTQDIYTMLLL